MVRRTSDPKGKTNGLKGPDSRRELGFGAFATFDQGMGHAAARVMLSLVQSAASQQKIEVILMFTVSQGTAAMFPPRL